MTIRSIERWHEKARPEPDGAAFNVQLGCHLEEITEMLECLKFDDPVTAGLMFVALMRLQDAALLLKSGKSDVTILDRQELLDSLADQVVTAIGVGHCAGMRTAIACERVDLSNWSKYVDGEPVFNETGKVAKGPRYCEPDLAGLY